MSDFYDIMIDLETTGTSPDETGIIQIAAVKFNLKTRTVNTASFFDRCLWLAPKRFWDESTRGWWYGKNRAVLQTIQPRMEDPGKVFRAFWDWSNEGNDQAKPLRFWSKPTHFDFAFVESYCKQYDLPNPYHFREATDLNSFIRGLARDPEAKLEYVDFQGPAHNALVDTLNQVKNLFAAMDHYA